MYLFLFFFDCSTVLSLILHVRRCLQGAKYSAALFMRKLDTLYVMTAAFFACLHEHLKLDSWINLERAVSRERNSRGDINDSFVLVCNSPTFISLECSKLALES